MIKGCYLGLSALVFSNMAFSGEMGPSSPLPDNHFFVGIGGSYNSASLEKQTIYGKGVSSAYVGPDLASSGSAAGTSSPFYQNDNLFSPNAQIGYLQSFKNELNFWGAKVTYNYLNAHLSNDGMTIPQSGLSHQIANV